MTMPTIDDFICARGWDAQQALNMVAILEEFIEAIWKVHGPDMANQLHLHFNQVEMAGTGGGADPSTA